MKDFKRDFEGRVISVLASCGNLNVNFVSIYAPNTLRARKEFFTNLHEFFFTNSELIIGGDFNCIDATLDKKGGNSNAGFAGKEEVKKLKADFNLCDIWRKMNPHTKQFTWFNTKGSVACRLDKFLIARALTQQAQDCSIKALPSIRSRYCASVFEHKKFLRTRAGCLAPKYVDLIRSRLRKSDESIFRKKPPTRER